MDDLRSFTQRKLRVLQAPRSTTARKQQQAWTGTFGCNSSLGIFTWNSSSLSLTRNLCVKCPSWNLCPELESFLVILYLQLFTWNPFAWKPLLDLLETLHLEPCLKPGRTFQAWCPRVLRTLFGWDPTAAVERVSANVSKIFKKIKRVFSKGEGNLKVESLDSSNQALCQSLESGELNDTRDKWRKARGLSPQSLCLAFSAFLLESFWILILAICVFQSLCDLWKWLLLYTCGFNLGVLVCFELSLLDVWSTSRVAQVLKHVHMKGLTFICLTWNHSHSFQPSCVSTGFVAVFRVLEFREDDVLLCTTSKHQKHPKAASRVYGT